MDTQLLSHTSQVILHFLMGGAVKSHCKGVGTGRDGGLWPSLQSTTVVLGPFYVIDHLMLKRLSNSCAHTFSVEDQILNTLGLVNYTISFSTTHLYLCSTKAATEHGQSINE